MPNSGHRWTELEETDALVMPFGMFHERHPSITKDAYRVRRNTLRKAGYRVLKTAAADKPVATKTACKVCAFLDKLPPAERADWEDDLRAPVKGSDKVSHRAIEDSLKAAGADVEETSVRRHRRNHLGR